MVVAATAALAVVVAEEEDLVDGLEVYLIYQGQLLEAVGVDCDLHDLNKWRAAHSCWYFFASMIPLASRSGLSGSETAWGLIPPWSNWCINALRSS